METSPTTRPDAPVWIEVYAVRPGFESVATASPQIGLSLDVNDSAK